jgi:type I restriction enzyme M protein
MTMIMDPKPGESVYDPTCGSGGLLLNCALHLKDEGKEYRTLKLYGQEINLLTSAIARMNMFLHGIEEFSIIRGDTLANPAFLHNDELKKFNVILANPPYSINWIGDADPTLINDDRFAPAGVLAPKSKADFAFVLHSLSYLSSKGRAALVCFPGLFYRGGAEQKIRKYLVDNNYVETIIALAPNLFYGTSIAVTILVLSKNKTENRTQFIDATGENFFKKVTNNNEMTNAHIEKVMEMFDSKKEVVHVTTTINNTKIAENDYNLSVNSYVEPKDTREKINIEVLNKEVITTVKKIEKLRTNIDNLVNKIKA